MTSAKKGFVRSSLAAVSVVHKEQVLSRYRMISEASDGIFNGTSARGHHPRVG